MRQRYFSSVVKPEDGSNITEEFRNLYNWVNGNLEVINVSLRTTNASVTDIVTIPVLEGDNFLVEAQIIGVKDAGGDRALYHLEGFFYRNSAGNVTQQGSTTSITAIESDANWNATLNADTTNQTIDVRVTGVAATNITWKAIVRYKKVA